MSKLTFEQAKAVADMTVTSLLASCPEANAVILILVRPDGAGGAFSSTHIEAAAAVTRPALARLMTELAESLLDGGGVEGLRAAPEVH